ncbi:DUF6488 family protein [Allosphingosinicella humi]
MRTLLLAFAVAGAVASPALAHPSHDAKPEQASRKPIAQTAQDQVIRLVSQAKLDASWSSAKAIKSEKRTVKGAEQWVVTFRNDAAAPEKRLLHVVLADGGTFISAGHTLR